MQIASSQKLSIRSTRDDTYQTVRVNQPLLRGAQFINKNPLISANMTQLSRSTRNKFLEKPTHFQTIDPLLLEALNLNHQKMNQILSRIHNTRQKITNQDNSLLSSIDSVQSPYNINSIDSTNHQKLQSPLIQRRVQKTIIRQRVKSTLQGNNISYGFKLPNLHFKYNSALSQQKSQNRTNDVNSTVITKRNNKLTTITQNLGQGSITSRIQRSPTGAVITNVSKTGRKQTGRKQTVETIHSNLNESPHKNVSQTARSSQKSYVSAHSKSNVKNYSKKNNNVSLKSDNQLVFSKKEQIIADYVPPVKHSLKKSKSQYLNSFDVYRYQIENHIAKLTPIQALQDAEKMIRRVKRRHQHLYNFPMNQYLQLCRQDINLL